MIARGEVDKLWCTLAPQESVLSLYLDVPADPAGLRELPARVTDLISAAAAGQPGKLRAEDEQVARGALLAPARQWLGRTVAIFVCGDIGLLEVVPLPGRVTERAVLAVRPHVRPLLTALQRHPDHRIVIIDRRHVWLLAVTADGIESVLRAAGDDIPTAGFGGWHGLDSYRVQRRVTELARHHYRDAAAVLDQAERHGGRQPLVIGGHADGVKHLLAQLPSAVRDSYVGCFVADPQTLTPARARDRAAPVIAHWGDQREQQLVSEIAAQSADFRAAVGLHACLAAVNADAVSQLLIPDEGMVAGHHCERCGALSLTSDGCCDWGAASRAVPDLLEEMARRTLYDDGQVVSIRSLPFRAAARLR